MDPRPLPPPHSDSSNASNFNNRGPGLAERGNLALISVHGDPAVSKGREALGAQNVYVRHLGEALVRQGWRVDMFTRRSDPSQAQIVDHGPHCRTIRLEAGPAEFIDRHHLYQCLPQFLEAFLDFQVRSRVQYALVHTNYWLSSWVGMELRQHQLFKHVHTYHSLGAHSLGGHTQESHPHEGQPKERLAPEVGSAHRPLYASASDPISIAKAAEERLAIEKISLEKSDLVIATSPQERDYLRQLVSHPRKIEILPCGTDLQTFAPLDPALARQQLKLSPTQKLVLYAGRFDPRKGLEILVRAMADPAMAAHPDSLLLVAGGSRPDQADGQERDRIESLIQALNLGDRVRFLGRLDQDILARYYAAADLCCLPSYEESFGLAALEAMACATPVVASAVGGLNFTVLSEQTGLLVPPGDVSQLAEAMARILGDRPWAAYLGRASRARVEAHFSWDGIARRLSEVYGDLLKDLHSEFFVGMSAPSGLLHRQERISS
jgi:D-inositol-3-phosphate glycosyltransferase